MKLPTTNTRVCMQAWASLGVLFQVSSAEQSQHMLAVGNNGISQHIGLSTFLFVLFARADAATWLASGTNESNYEGKNFVAKRNNCNHRQQASKLLQLIKQPAAWCVLPGNVNRFVEPQVSIRLYTNPRQLFALLSQRNRSLQCWDKRLGFCFLKREETFWDTVKTCLSLMSIVQQAQTSTVRILSRVLRITLYCRNIYTI